GAVDDAEGDGAEDQRQGVAGAVAQLGEAGHGYSLGRRGNLHQSAPIVSPPIHRPHGPTFPWALELAPPGGAGYHRNSRRRRSVRFRHRITRILRGHLMPSNRQFLLAQRPVGLPRHDTFRRVETPVGEPAEGQVLVRNHYLSIDPAMRGWMNEGKSYIEPVRLGEVMRALGVGEVVASRHPQFPVGGFVGGALGVQDYFLGEPKGLYPVDPKLAPLPLYLSALGMTGLTAYFALLEVGAPKAGETVVISGAAGAVGGIAGQIAKLKGCRVVGIAGGEQKCRYLVEELGFDAAIDYKHEDVAT